MADKPETKTLKAFEDRQGKTTRPGTPSPHCASAARSR